jgi:Tfp pilus assembly protein FimT
MALLVIVAALAWPRFSPILTDIKLTSDAQQLAGVLRMARQEAITGGEATKVVFYVQDKKNPRYLYYGKSSYYLSPGVKYVGNSPFKSIYKSQPACIFLPSGRASQGGTVTLKAENKIKYVIVLNTTGRIRVSDTPPESWEEGR